MILNARATDVDEKGLATESPEGPLRIDANNVIWATGVKGSRLGQTLGVEVDPSGRVVVGEDLAIPGYPNVFVIGNLAHRTDTKTGQPVPAVAQGPIQGGRFVGETIAAEIDALGKGQAAPERKTFHYKDRGTMAIVIS